MDATIPVVCCIVGYAAIAFFAWCLCRIAKKGEEREKPMPTEYWDAAGEYDEGYWDTEESYDANYQG